MWLEESFNDTAGALSINIPQKQLNFDPCPFGLHTITLNVYCGNSWEEDKKLFSSVNYYVLNKLSTKYYTYRVGAEIDIENGKITVSDKFQLSNNQRTKDPVRHPHSYNATEVFNDFTSYLTNEVLNPITNLPLKS